jgi:hypothetical protein
MLVSSAAAGFNKAERSAVVIGKGRGLRQGS